MHGREDLGQFSGVDDASRPREFVNLLDQLLAQAGERKQRTYQLMQVRPGDQVLDVGCGTGADVRALAEVVGPGGRAVGIDQSETMLKEARERTRTLGTSTQFKRGDARSLPFPNAVFDACRCERVIEHIPEPQRVVQEMVRVTKPGGRIVAYEPDWGTTVVASDDIDLTRRVTAFIASSVQNGLVGRHLLRMFRDAGLEQVQIDADAWVIQDFELGSSLLRLDQTLARAREAGVVTESEVNRWLDSLRESGKQQRFVGSLTFFYAAGVKPATGWRRIPIPTVARS